MFSLKYFMIYIFTKNKHISSNIINNSNHNNSTVTKILKFTVIVFQKRCYKKKGELFEIFIRIIYL